MKNKENVFSQRKEKEKKRKVNGGEREKEVKKKKKKDIIKDYGLGARHEGLPNIKEIYGNMWEGKKERREKEGKARYIKIAT